MAFLAIILLLFLVGAPGNWNSLSYVLGVGALALGCIGYFLIACGVRTNLEIGPEGFTVRWLWKKHSYRWRDVENFRPVKQYLGHGMSRTVVGFDGRLRDNPGLGLRPRRMHNYCRTPDEMIELMNRYREAALARPDSDG